MRTLMAEALPPVAERVTVEDAGTRLLAHLEAMGRKPSTMRSYRSQWANQVVPRIGQRPIADVRREDIENLVADCARVGLSAKTIRNISGLLNGVAEFAIKRGWATENPCRYVDLPSAGDDDRDIRFLELEEIEALIRAVPDGDFGRVHRVMFLTAALTGLRRGELLALRWIDVDWTARRVRVRRNYVRGTLGTPKSRRASRSVPMADRLGGELDLLYRTSLYRADENLVFGNPHTGRPLDGAALLKAFRRALKRAGVRQVRVHDLRHTFGTTIAARGVPMRTLQEWMGHRDLRTTLIYADYAPDEHEVDLVNEAFGRLGHSFGHNLNESERTSDDLSPANAGVVT